MLAVIKTGGKQYIVSPGEKLKVEKLGESSGKNLAFGEVLLVGEADGSKVKVGAPFVSTAKVSAALVSQGRHKKIFMLKYKPKKRYRLRKGHRQHFTEVEVKTIDA